MTIEEIFSTLSAHMIKGLMVHAQFSDYYNFLGLEGYKKCHQYHYYEQTCNLRNLSNFYIKQYNKLIPQIPIDNPKQIPSSWYRYMREDVDPTTKRNAVKSGLQAWISWEKSTINLLQNSFKELYNLNQISSAFEMERLLCEVQQELHEVQRYYMEKRSVDFNIDNIISQQKEKAQKYQCKKKELCWI